MKYIQFSPWRETETNLRDQHVKTLLIPCFYSNIFKQVTEITLLGQVSEVQEYAPPLCSETTANTIYSSQTQISTCKLYLCATALAVSSHGGYRLVKGLKKPHTQVMIPHLGHVRTLIFPPFTSLNAQQLWEGQPGPWDLLLWHERGFALNFCFTPTAAHPEWEQAVLLRN